MRSTTQRRGSTTNRFVIIHPADIQDRDGGILLLATLFGMYPFLKKLFADGGYQGRTFKRPWRRSCHSSKLKSSSAPIGRKDTWCFQAVGSSNAPLLGSTAAEGLPRIGRISIATRWRSCGLPQSASCSENFVIPPDVFGQTLRAGSRVCIRYTGQSFEHYAHCKDRALTSSQRRLALQLQRRGS